MLLADAIDSLEGFLSGLHTLTVRTGEVDTRDALGYTGNPVIRTPHLDSLAALGTYFEDAFVTTAIAE